MKIRRCSQAMLTMYLLLTVGLAYSRFNAAKVHGATVKELRTHAWIFSDRVLSPGIVRM